MERWNARLGLVLCALYSLIYGGFVFLNAFWPDAMELTPWAGVNVAVLYGCGLILAAFALAILYGMLCRDSVTHRRSEERA